ncbi:division/cell wall cluster transcriptional repressor MraZ [Roseomonas rosulenta]|uniref:division/cell wall cluster transcriptional repressor MraZ n=1 Tax=Roseomonas rosulenta TaxID=2748667 RepID=UPI0018DF17FF|nr:cell division/cell wall cluster transcriptional repressor MraZ [Roseomonas rosulenta]
MTRFLGTHKGKLDKKGRISVPAGFRSALAGLGEQELVFFPSYTQPCIECWPARVFDEATAGHDGLDLFSKDADDLAGAVFAQAAQMRPDAEGRVSLEERHIAAAGLTDALLFIGVRRRFQIWDADRGEAYLRDSVVRARDNGLTLAPAPRTEPRP